MTRALQLVLQTSIYTYSEIQCSVRQTLQRFFATFAGNGGGGGEGMAPDISRVLEHIATKFQLLHLVLGVKLSSGGTSDFVRRRCVLEIQVGSQITGSTNNIAGFIDTRRSENNTGVYDYVRNVKNV